MSGAARKTKLSRYEVTIRRQVEYTAVLEVEARSAEEAADIAESKMPEAWHQQRWRTESILNQIAKAKIQRGMP